MGVGRTGPRMFPALVLLPLLQAVVADEGTGYSSMKEYPLPYPPSENNVCRDTQHEYYNRKVRMCCSKCPPGHYLLSECSSSADSVCTPCGPNSFTEVWNRLKQCHHCEAPCREDTGLIETLSCNASQNRICSCPSNTYCAFESPPSCQVCTSLTLCQKGFGVSAAGTRNSNTECSPCPLGMFSDVESYDAPCIPHRNCSMVSVPGDSTSDAICADSDAGNDPAYKTHSRDDTSPSESTEPIVDPSDAPTLLDEGAASPAAVAAKNTSVPLGLIAGGLLFAVVGLAGMAFLLTAAKKRYCSSHPRTQRAQLNTVSAKQFDQKQLDPMALSFNNNEPEHAHLLNSLESSNCALEFPPGPADIGRSVQDKGERSGKMRNGGVSNGAATHHEPPSLNNICSAESSCTGHAHVNLTCIVNVCKPDPAASMAEEGRGTAAEMNDHLPLSMEEGNVQMKPEELRSFEMGGTLLYTKGEGFPLSVEDTEMKISEFTSHLKMR